MYQDGVDFEPSFASPTERKVIFTELSRECRSRSSRAAHRSYAFNYLPLRSRRMMTAIINFDWTQCLPPPRVTSGTETQAKCRAIHEE